MAVPSALADGRVGWVDYCRVPLLRRRRPSDNGLSLYLSRCLFFFSLCALVVCVRTTRVTDLSVTVFLLCVSVVCIRTSLCLLVSFTSLCLGCVYTHVPCVPDIFFPVFLSLGISCGCVYAYVPVLLSLPGHSVKCVCILTAFFVLTLFPRVRTMTAFAIPTSLQQTHLHGHFLIEMAT